MARVFPNSGGYKDVEAKYGDNIFYSQQREPLII